MNKKKILFFGDNIPGRNYGSIATTEVIMKLVQSVAEGNEVRYLDYRYTRKEAPAGGLPPYVISFTKRDFKQELSAWAPSLKKAWKGVRNIDDSKIHVPYKFSQYEEFYQRMMRGEVLPYEKKMIEWSDVVIFSGEGTLVHGIDRYGKYLVGGLYLLFIVWVVKHKFNKPISIVNHTVDPENEAAEEIIKNVYPLLDFVAVRERFSLKVLDKLDVTNAQFVPDALFAYKPQPNWEPSAELSEQIDFSKPYICIGDTSGLSNSKYSTSVKWDIVEVYSKLIDRLKDVVPQIIFVDGFRGKNKSINKIIKKNKLGFVNLLNCSYHDLFHVFKGSELFVSGRWHASILASLANAPVLLMGADSHKTKALFDIIGYEGYFFDLAPLPINIDEFIEATKDTLARKEIIKKQLAKKIEELSSQAKENVAHLKSVLSSI